MNPRCIGTVLILTLILLAGLAFQATGSAEELGLDCPGNIGPGADLRNCDLSNGDLSYANLEGANLQGANLRNTSLIKANFKQANLKGVNLNDTPLVWVNFTEANLQGASLIGASLQNVNFRNADLIDANLRNAELIDVDFTGADLTGADPTNVMISRVKVPDGTMVNAKGWSGTASAFNRATRGPEESKGNQTAERTLGIFGWILGALIIAFISYFLPKKIATRKNNIPLFLGLIALLMNYVWWNMMNEGNMIWGHLFYLSIVPGLVGLIGGVWLMRKKIYSPGIIIGSIVCFIALTPHMMMFVFAFAVIGLI